MRLRVQEVIFFILLVMCPAGPVWCQDAPEDEVVWDLDLSEEDEAVLDILLGGSPADDSDSDSNPEKSSDTFSDPSQETESSDGSGDASDEEDEEDEDLVWDESLEEGGSMDLLSILMEDEEDASGKGFFDLSESSFMIGTSAGRRDNVLFAADNLAEDRGLFGVNAEYLYWGLNYGGHRMTVYTFFDHIGFLGEGQADKEQVGVASFSYELPVVNEHKAFIDLSYLYQDQVFDVSTSEANLVTIQAQGHRFSGSGGWKKKFGDAWRAELGMNGERQEFVQPLDDYWQLGPEGYIEWRDGDRHRIRWTNEMAYRDYDTRTETITGIPLRFRRFESELEWRMDFGEDRQWRTSLAASYRRNEDNGGGFFDYHRYTLEPSIEYEADGWFMEFGYTWRNYRYDLQFFGTELIARDDSIVFFRIERDFNKSWRWFAELETQVTESVDPRDEYEVFSVQSGIQFRLTW